jgi:hypothetical protein
MRSLHQTRGGSAAATNPTRPSTPRRPPTTRRRRTHAPTRPSPSPATQSPTTTTHNPPTPTTGPITSLLRHPHPQEDPDHLCGPPHAKDLPRPPSRRPLRPENLPAHRAPRRNPLPPARTTGHRRMGHQPPRRPPSLASRQPARPDATPTPPHLPPTHRPRPPSRTPRAHPARNSPRVGAPSLGRYPATPPRCSGSRWPVRADHRDRGKPIHVIGVVGGMQGQRFSRVGVWQPRIRTPAAAADSTGTPPRPAVRTAANTTPHRNAPRPRHDLSLAPERGQVVSRSMSHAHWRASPSRS